MYIRYVAMFHMAKRSGIQWILCDFRYATISWQGICSRFSNFMQRPVSCLPWNYTLVHKTWNLPNNSEFKFAQITHDHFCEHAITKLSTVPWELGLLNNMQSWQAQLCITHCVYVRTDIWRVGTRKLTMRLCDPHSLMNIEQEYRFGALVNFDLSFNTETKWPLYNRLNSTPLLVQIMARRCTGDWQTSHYLNQWWFSLLTHLCVARPPWFKVHIHVQNQHTPVAPFNYHARYPTDDWHQACIFFRRSVPGRYFTASHYHHYARVLTGVENL